MSGSRDTEIEAWAGGCFLRLQDILWAALTLLAALSSPAQPWTLGPVTLVAAGIAFLTQRRSPAFAALVLVLGAGPLWTAAAAAGSSWASLLILGSIPLFVLGQSPLPIGLRWLLLAGFTVEALRAALTGTSLPALAETAGPFWLLGLALVGCLGGTHPGPIPVGALLLAGVVCVGRSAELLREGAQSQASIEALVSADLLDQLHPPTADGLALFALSRAPTDHALAEDLVDRVGLDTVLSAGWDPSRAPLSPALRLDVARWLDEKGRGGAALRLLRRGRADPTVAWTAVLYARLQGRADLEAALGESLAPPLTTPSLPGSVALALSMTTNGELRMDIDLRKEAATIRLRVEGESFAGAPRVALRLDNRRPIEHEIPDGPSELRISGPISPGPHRLTVRFLNDAVGVGGDRNVQIAAITAD